jgi:type III secretory pathway component EscU
MSGRMLMLPLIDELDVWVNRKTDDRYIIQTIRNAAELRGVPLIANVELRPAPFTDVVYNIPIPQQNAWLQQTC